MYMNYKHRGKTIAEWQKLFNYEYSQYELYIMAKDGCDFQLFLSKEQCLTTAED